MGRLKPSSRKAAAKVALELKAVAEGLDDSRPFLGKLYRILAEEIEAALSVPDGPFRIQLPEGAMVEKWERSVNICPPDFDSVTYYNRLVKGASKG